MHQNNNLTNTGPPTLSDEEMSSWLPNFSRFLSVCATDHSQVVGYSVAGESIYLHMRNQSVTSIAVATARSVERVRRSGSTGAW